MVKIVVTGALGHIGSRLIRALPNSFPSAQIVMVDSLLTQRYCSLFGLPDSAQYRFIEADVVNTDLTELLAGAQATVHLAAITNAAGSFSNREEVETNNYKATESVARACSACNVPMIFLSSTSVYGTQNSIVDEDCPATELAPQSPYAETKIREENLLKGLSNSHELKYVICRFGTIFGFSEGMRFHTAVNKFCWQATMGLPLTIWRTAYNQLRPYLDLTDAVNALSFIIDKGIFNNSIYNVLTANATVRDIVEIIQENIPSLDIDYVDHEIMNQLSYEVANTKLQSKGFTYVGKLEKGIRETLDQLRSLRADD